jgi:hypothetical protein
MSDKNEIAVTNAEPAEIEWLTVTEAQKLTAEIKQRAGTLWQLIAEAYARRAWSALGYKSWDEYCGSEFGSTRLRIPREERSDAVCSLRESGLSLRAISAATGSSVNTIRKDLGQVCQSDTPEPPPTPVVPGAPTAATPGMTDRVEAALNRAVNKAKIDVASMTVTKQTAGKSIVGTDGKKYVVKDLKKRNRPPLGDDFRNANTALTKITKRLTGIAADDRFTRNATSLRRYQSDLIRARDAIDAIVLRLEQAPGGEIETAIVVDMFSGKSGDPT